MNFYELLKNGCCIRIEPGKFENKNFDPAEFWLDEFSGELFSWAPGFGIIKRTDLTIIKFNKHIKKMISAGFKIIIAPVKTLSR